MNSSLQHRLRHALSRATATLLAESVPAGHWEGELSASALSTATAITALALVARHAPDRREAFASLIDRGLAWLAAHQNADGGWGDTVKSVTNISTTMLGRAAFFAAGAQDRFAATVAAATACAERMGGVAAVHARYGKDRTFSAPILTQCALAGLVDWREVAPLPFELGCLPHSFYKWVQLPVVSYALPALIAIGQVRHFHAPSRNPLVRWLRNFATRPTLRLLETIQPGSGGFLEATPLTSFVTMSLAAIGQAKHPVTRRAVEFLVASARPDGSWPIDTNLATWVTTLAVNALPLESLPQAQRLAIRDWLLGQQYTEVHPYTQAAPGGWAWTNLTGGVPDADDTPGAMMALLKLSQGEELTPRLRESLTNAAGWLLDLQNRDGGWPTFCRGWGTLPFDRSAADLTAHALRALDAWRRELSATNPAARQVRRIDKAVARGLRYLERQQRADGSWLPLWFGNQHAPDDENPVYGTSRVLAAYRELGLAANPSARRGVEWLAGQQNADGGWGGLRGTPSSVEETALALEALTAFGGLKDEARLRGWEWLLRRVEDETFHQTAPIGFYFAKLWYFERLYPLVFSVAALARASMIEVSDETATSIPLATTCDGGDGWRAKAESVGARG